MNLHDNLGRYGADASAGSRSRLESAEVREVLDARVRRGRRRRAVVGGVGAVAGVSLVAVGVWVVVPGVGGDGGGDLQAAAAIDESLAARGTVYEVDSSAPVDPEFPINLALPDDLACGVPFEVVEGVTVHDPAVVDNGVVVAGRSLVATLEGPTEEWLRGLDEAETDEAWENLVGSNPDAVDSEHEQQVFETQEVSQEGAGITTTTVPLLLRDGVVASIGIASGRAGEGPGGDAAPWRAWTPAPGTCETGADPEGYYDGTYEPVLVTQIWTTNLRQPLATVVHSAGDVEYTGLEQAPQDLEPQDQAELLPPDGDMYQAFVMPPPQVSCTPFADQLDAGHPALQSVEYRVEVRGVAESLAREIGAQEPFVTLPEGFDPWYSGHESWVVSESVDESRLVAGPQTLRDPFVEWTRTSDGRTAVVPGGNDALHDPSCYYELPGGVTEGAVFLVVQGFDIEVMADLGYDGSTHNPAEWYTWIYLGEAEPVEY